MSSTDRALIACPIHECKEYCIDQYISNVLKIKQKHVNCEILLVDNSESSVFFNMLCEKYKNTEIVFDRIIVMVDKEDPERIHKRLVESYNIIREYLIENSFDYLYIIECDVIPPTDAISKFIMAMEDPKRGAVQGYYYSGFDKVAFNKGRFLLTGNTFVRTSAINDIKFRYEPTHLKALQDHFLMIDLITKGYSIGFIDNADAEHLHMPGGSRGWEKA